MTHKPTASELKILQILWKKRQSTVKEINDELNKIEIVGYTTTLKIMQLMADKGILSREKSGRSHIYRAELNEEETKNQFVNKLLNSMFSGSAANLVMQALGNSKTSKSDLKKIKEMIKTLESEADESN